MISAMLNERQIERVEIFFDQALGEDVVFKNAWIANFQARKVAGNYFIANAAGGWLIITEEEFLLLTSVAIPVSLFDKTATEHLILSLHNAQSYFKRYERWTEPHFRHPVHHIILSTLRCNLACSYCHAAVVPSNAGKGFDLSIDLADAIIEFASNSRSQFQSFEFQGGESLLNGEVLRHAIHRIREVYTTQRKEVSISIQTNSTLLTGEWMGFFEENHVNVGTSLDGPAELHDANRVFAGGRGSHRRVSENVEKYQLPTLATITRKSLPVWRQIIDAQLATGKRVVSLNNVYPINSAKRNWNDVGLSMEEYLTFYVEAARYLKSLWRDDYYPLELRLYLALKKLAVGRDVDFADFGNPCGMVHSQITYHTNGDIYTCDEGRDFEEFKLGNVVSDPYDAVVFGPAMRRLKTLSLPNDTECQTCAYRAVCSTCPVYDRAETGELQSTHAGTPKCIQTKVIFDTVVSWFVDDPDLINRLAGYHRLSRCAGS